MAEKEAPKENDAGGKRFELFCGIVLTILAAVLAITNLASGHFDGNQMIAENEKTSAYSWYDAKSIKQTLVEGQLEILQSLIDADVISQDKVGAVEDRIAGFTAKVEKYSNEKNEILKGSEAVGEENWAQDVDGVLGVVIGAQEWEDEANKLDAVGNVFDLATLFLELSLVIGAISLILDQKKLKNTFFYMMTGVGAVGVAISAVAIVQGMGI